MPLSRTYNSLEPLFIKRDDWQNKQSTAPFAEPGIAGGFEVMRDISQGLGQMEVSSLPKASPGMLPFLFQGQQDQNQQTTPSFFNR